MRRNLLKKEYYIVALLFLGLFFIRLDGWGQAITKLTGTGTDISTVGTVTWTNPGYITANDNSYALASLSNSTSHYLRATNFGFSVPSNAIITGITVNIGRYASGNNVADADVLLLKNGAVTGTDKAITGTAWPTAEANQAYGSVVDLWGQTWSPNDINNANFGVVLSVSSSRTRNIYVDYIQITVTYMFSGFWYKADAGVSGTTAVTAWADQSGNANDAINSGTVSLATSSINFNPSLSFSTVDGQFLTESYSAPLRFVVVTKPTITTDLAGLIGAGPGTVTDKGIRLSNDAADGITDQSWLGDQNTDDWINLTGTSRINGLSSSIHNFKWHIVNQTRASALASSQYYLGGYYAGRPYSGNIAEVIAYNSNSTPTDAVIESYLAVKYGITLGTNASPVGYVNSSNTTIWTGNSTFQNDVHGIGRDDVYGLNQLSSKSENPGTDILTIQSGNTFTTPTNAQTGTSLSDGQFFITGHNGASAITTTTLSTGVNVIARKWYAQVTGSLPTESFQFNLSGASFGSYCKIGILIADDASLTTNLRFVEGTLSSSILTVNNAAISNGKYFTVATLANVTAGSIVGNQTICYNTSPTTLTSGADGAGFGTISYKWESSIDGTNWNTISNATSSTYSSGALTQLTYFRRTTVATLGGVSCNSASTLSVNITVRPVFTSGSIASTGETICYGGTPTTQIGSTAAASGGDNTITYQWQYSTDNTFATGVTTVANNAATYTPNQALTQTTYYRRQAKDGTCNTSFASSTNAWAVTVNTAATAPTGISGTTTICAGATTILTATGGSVGSGAAYEWGTGSVVGTNTIAGATSVSYTTVALASNTTYWVRRVGSAPCSNTTGGVTQLVTVNTLPAVPTATAGTAATCSQITANWAASTNATKYYLDVSTASNFSSFVAGYNNLDVLNLTTYNITGLTAGTTYYYRVRASNTCGTSDNSDVITYGTIPNASIGSVTGTSPLCIGSTDTYSANPVVLGGGTGAWSTSDATIATVDASGLVTGVANGSCDIIYTITGGCGGTKTARQSLTVESPGDPAVFGSNSWNVYVYQGNNIGLSGIYYKGYYTESKFSFSTTDRWSINGSPDEATGYLGCPVTDDNHTFVYKREGFPSGKYQITVGHDDSYQLYIDGNLVSSSGAWDNRNPEVLTNFYTLTGTSQIEFRVAENGGESRGALTFTEVCINPTDGGSIAGAQTICYNGDPIAFTSSSVASGQTGTLEYKWQYSTVDSPYSWQETGATGLTYDDNTALTADRWYHRLARVDCKTDWTGAAESNVLKVTVTAVPSATISYSGSPFCTSVATPQPVTISGSGAYTGGAYASTSGLTINTSTGAITPSTSTAGSYTVTYTIPASGGCSAVPVTTNVTITTLPVATFSYSGSPYCSNASNPSPTFSGGGVAGVFSSTAGLNFISTATGQINLATSAPGTYNVTNTIAASGGCAQVTATNTITITALPTATISYSGTPFCKSVTTPQTVTRTGTSGGTYTALPSGLSIDSSTGAITPNTSTADTYTVTYTIASADGCGIITVTTLVMVTAAPTAGITNNTGSTILTCSRTSISVTATGGDTYLWTGGSTPSTASNSLSSPGTYTVTVSSASGCTAQASIIITQDTTPPTAGITNNTGSTILTCSRTSISVTATGGGTYSWSGGLGTSASASITTPGIYTVTVTSDNGCTTQASIIITQDTTPPTAYNVTGGGLYCSGGNGVPIGLDNSQSGVNYQLYRDAVAIGSTVSGTTGSAITFGYQTVEGIYTAKAINATSFCVQDMSGTATVTIGDTTPPLITKCLAGGEALCVKDLPAAITTIQGFIAAGGEVTDNCTAPMTVSYKDVITPGSLCEVRRTYTITDASTNTATCTQVFTITDTEAPVINSVVNLVVPPTNENCGAELTINVPTDVTENCSFVEEGAHFEYTIAGTTKKGNGTISDTFPEGTTLITWTITDLCGHVSASKTQSVLVAFSITPISYDNGSSATGEGSGVQPMQTSTHEYFVDNKIPEADYTYTWGLYVDNNGVPGAEVDASYYSLTAVNLADVQITFKNTSLIPTGNYIISVIKTKNGIICEKPKTLSVKVVENTFDTYLNLAGPQCQAGETGTPSTIIWEVTFPGDGVAPYSLNYRVSLTDESNNETMPCSGSLSNITRTGITSSLLHTSGCGNTTQMPYMQVEKTETNSYTLRLKYTINSVTAKNFKVSIQIDATDKFSVSEIDPDNNAETLIEHGVPNTSAITTD